MLKHAIRLLTLSAILATLTLLFTMTHATLPVAHAGYAYGADNTTASHTWTHADPNTADPPGNGRLGSNYYYLKAYAAGPEVVCTVFTAGNWEIALENADKQVLAQEWPLTTGGQVFVTNAHIGSLYMCRISDLGSAPAKDYAQLDSGPVGDVTCADEPGPILDPNFDVIPMQPIPQSQVSCPASVIAPYTPGDPRLAPPLAQTAKLGPIVNGAVYTFTITGGASCDLSAGAFYGHQGHAATLSITDPAGALVNGMKWGAQTPNPNTQHEEYVGTDAGVLAPGTYDVRYNGPTQSNQAIWAICV